ncbi:MAG: CPBP family intramembrane metalloprotease [Gemmatimonadaceae bacterium]|jgi:hypothetical protein|nr:CPBP family intramembrane metalloprotease [Gemmatimonadaceae bacterium]
MPASEPVPVPIATASTDARSALVLASPIGIIATCALAQLLFGRALGVWAWAPTMLLFWGLIVLLIVRVRGRQAFGAWLRPAAGAWGWSALAVAAGLLSLPGFLAHWSVLATPLVGAAWLVFALVNPWLEEAYWRGLLMDATHAWGAVLSVTWSATWFALSHPLIWGVHATAMRQWPVIVALFVVGAIWGVAYRRTASLRWTIAGHMLANALGLAVPILLNLHNPAAR